MAFQQLIKRWHWSFPRLSARWFSCTLTVQLLLLLLHQLPRGRNTSERSWEKGLDLMPSWSSKKLRSLTTQSENLHIQCHEKVFSSFQIIKKNVIFDNKNLNKYKMQISLMIKCIKKNVANTLRKVTFDHQLKKKHVLLIILIVALNINSDFTLL